MKSIPKISLNGIWETGIDSNYNARTTVPGLSADPAVITPGHLWYRRQVVLPPGVWTSSSLLLKGARFCPRIYVDGDLVSESQGGMTWTFHELDHPSMKPGVSVQLEIALCPLNKIPNGDASRIPEADRWRSNISSCLWDDVELRFHGPARIKKAIPWTDFQADELTIDWEVENPLQGNVTGPEILSIEILNNDGELLSRTESAVKADTGHTKILLKGKCRPWSPDSPLCYTIKCSLIEGNRIIDQTGFTWGLKDFRVDDKKFILNGHPVQLRAGTMVWHRFCRDKEAQKLAWDIAWFEQNVIKRLKSHGANTLRFHLGMPPDAILDLCDRNGLMVQAEWSFFHGMTGSRESLVEQWRTWFEVCLRHPSVVLHHPWNETEGEQLDTAFSALNELSQNLPALVVSHRDVMHPHKYWWSLFENIGCYYDDTAQFPMPIMADEFGGNYLDGNCDPGGYKTLNETMLRFLGRGHTRELRLELHTEANARIAEYWRRIEAAGFSPFCIAGSWEDGNHHFLGALVEGKPKPVWNALTPAYAPVSCSIDVWDRNFLPGTETVWPLHLFNATDQTHTVNIVLRVRTPEKPGIVVYEANRQFTLSAFGHLVEDASYQFPKEIGEWILEAELIDPPFVDHPVISSWRVRTFAASAPDSLNHAAIYVPAEDGELRAFLADRGLKLTDTSENADVIIISRFGWRRFTEDTILKASCEAAIERGAGVVLMDCGPAWFGQALLEDDEIGQVQGVRTVPDPRIEQIDLFSNLHLKFREIAEPDSCLHPTENGKDLWIGLNQQSTWLWNGMRCGIIAPACDMEVCGMDRETIISAWAQRGASTESIRNGTCIAYELAGYYQFSEQPDGKVKEALREKVRSLVDDAPALAISIDPEGRIRETDIGDLYKNSVDGKATSLTPLAECGKDLFRAPVVEVGFEKYSGTLLISQLVTAGRLCSGYSHPDIKEKNEHYALRKDPAAQQFVLNMIARAAAHR